MVGGCLAGPGGSLVGGHVGLESTLCDIGYCTELLAGCWGAGVEHAQHIKRHMSHTSEKVPDPCTVLVLRIVSLHYQIIT